MSKVFGSTKALLALIVVIALIIGGVSLYRSRSTRLLDKAVYKEFKTAVNETAGSDQRGFTSQDELRAFIRDWADGKELKNAPGPSYVQKDTNGWQEKSTAFLVPPDAVQLVVMPCLFMAKAGEMQMKDVKIAEIDPQPLYAAAAERERQEKARYVPDEPERREKWPKPLRVVGNRLK